MTQKGMGTEIMRRGEKRNDMKKFTSVARKEKKKVSGRMEVIKNNKKKEEKKEKNLNIKITGRERIHKDWNYTLAKYRQNARKKKELRAMGNKE